MLDKLFLKYESGVKLTPSEITTLKKPGLVRIKSYLLKLYFVWNVHNEIMCRI